jgi:DNA adenine methylase
MGDKETFLEYQSEIFSANFNHRLDGINPDYETAFKYIYVMNHTYNGLNPERASYCHKEPGQHSKFNSIINKLTNRNWQIQLDRLNVIAQGDFKEIISEFDSPTTFIYLDPPYLNREYYYALNNFSIYSHAELAESLYQIEGRFALSYYYFDQLLNWYPTQDYRWIYQDVRRPSVANGATGREYLIMNY